MGPVGAGLAAVISQGLVGLLVIPGLWRILAGSRRPAAVPAAEAGTPEVSGP
jgi:hypothetical protein